MSYNSRYTGKQVEDALEKAITSLQPNDIQHLATKEEVSKFVDNQVLSIFTSVVGELVVVYGNENSPFTNGYVNEIGEVILEFNYD